MNLYEINRDIEDFSFEIDENTGEVLNASALDALQMERDEKIENIALYIKNLNALAADIKAEKDNLDERVKVVERKADGLKRYLASVLNGEKFETAKFKVSYRKSQSVVVGDEFSAWAAIHKPELIRTTIKTEPDKTAIRDAIKNGVAVVGAKLVETQSMSIK